jgi:hypothetical protein
MPHVTHNGFTALPTTVCAVLADSLPHSFLPRDGREHVHIQKYVSESVQSWNASKQLPQGEKQQQFYIRRNLIAFFNPLFPIPKCFFLHIPLKIILFHFDFPPQNLLRMA